MSTITAEERADAIARRAYVNKSQEFYSLSHSILAAIREAESELVEKWQVNFEVVRKQSDTATARAEKAEAERDAAIQEIALWARKYGLADADLAQSTSDRKNLKESLRYTEEKTRILLSALEVQAQEPEWSILDAVGIAEELQDRIRAAHETLAKVNQKWTGYEEPNARIGSGANIPTEVAAKPICPNGCNAGFNMIDGCYTDCCNCGALPMMSKLHNPESETASEYREIPGPVALRKIAQSTAEAPKPTCPKCGDANVGEALGRPDAGIGSCWRCYACHHVWPAEPVAERETPETDELRLIGLEDTMAGRLKEAMELAEKLESSRDEAREQLAAVTKSFEVAKCKLEKIREISV